MGMDSNIIKISMNEDCTMEIILPEHEKRYLCEQYVYMIRQYVQASKWFNDHSIDPEIKEQYWPTFQNLLHNLNFMYTLLSLAGVSHKDLSERIDVPF